MASPETFNPLANANVRLYKIDAASWATVRNAATASAEQDIASFFDIDTTWEIDRIGLTFNTSALPDNATITGAVIKIYPTVVTNTDSSDIDVVSSNPTDPTNFAVGDYAIAKWGSVVWGSISLATLAANLNVLNSITLDANGRANISLVGNSTFGLRNSRDTDNATPTGQNRIDFTGANTVLVVTYTLPVGAKSFTYFM